MCESVWLSVWQARQRLKALRIHLHNARTHVAPHSLRAFNTAPRSTTVMAVIMLMVQSDVLHGIVVVFESGLTYEAHNDVQGDSDGHSNQHVNRKIFFARSKQRPVADCIESARAYLATGG